VDDAENKMFFSAPSHKSDTFVMTKNLKINFTGGAPAADVFLYRFNSYYFPIFTYRSSNISTIAGSSSKNYELAKYLYLQYLGQFGIQ